MSKVLPTEDTLAGRLKLKCVQVRISWGSKYRGHLGRISESELPAQRVPWRGGWNKGGVYAVFSCGAPCRGCPNRTARVVLTGVVSISPQKMRPGRIAEAEVVANLGILGSHCRGCQQGGWI